MVEIHIPKLADRRQDLPLLQRHFLARFAAQYGKEIRGLTHRARIRLAQHGWPGNVRELENVLGHAAMMSLSDTIDVQDLPPYLQTERGAAQHGGEAPAGFRPVEVMALEEQERMLLVRALEIAGGNQSKAARSLRIGRDALRYKLKKHDLDEVDPRSSAAVG